MLFGEINYTSLSGSLILFCQKNATYSAYCKVWWRKDDGLRLFFRIWARPSLLLNATGCKDIIANWALSTLWYQFGEVTLLCQHDCAPVHKVSSLKTWLDKLGVE